MSEGFITKVGSSRIQMKVSGEATPGPPRRFWELADRNVGASGQATALGCWQDFPRKPFFCPTHSCSYGSARFTSEIRMDRFSAPSRRQTVGAKIWESPDSTKSKLVKSRCFQSYDKGMHPNGTQTKRLSSGDQDARRRDQAFGLFGLSKNLRPS